MAFYFSMKLYLYCFIFSGHGIGVVDLHIILTDLYSCWHLANVSN